VGESLVVDFTFLSWFVALEVVEREAFVLPDSPLASNDCGFGPGVENPNSGVEAQRDSQHSGNSALEVPAGTSGSLQQTRSLGRPVAPHETAFPHAPPSWLNPVRGLVLNKETAEHHAAIRARGWKLVVIPEPLWAFAASKAKNAHYARRDLLMSLIVPLAGVGFDPRPESAMRGEGRKTRAGPRACGEAAAARAGLQKEKVKASAEAREVR